MLALRRRQAKNFMAILLLSQGIPMINAGDELLRSTGGNNNTWCQDNDLGWMDWALADQNADMLRFVAGLIALRKRHRSLRRRNFLNGDDVQWFGTLGEPPRFGDASARELALTLYGRDADEPPLHVMLNASPQRRRPSYYRRWRVGPGALPWTPVRTRRRTWSSRPGNAASVRAAGASLVAVCWRWKVIRYPRSTNVGGIAAAWPSHGFSPTVSGTIVHNTLE